VEALALLDVSSIQSEASARGSRSASRVDDPTSEVVGDIAAPWPDRGLLLEGEGDRFVRERAQADVLQVQDDLDDVFLDAGEVENSCATPAARGRR